MRRHTLTLAALAAGLAMLFVVGRNVETVEGQTRSQGQAPGAGFAAVPGLKGGQDAFGAYEVVPNWPKPISALPGHEQWTWSCVQSVFAETPNRVFLLQRGELPVLTEGARRGVDGSGNPITLPPRNAALSSPPDNKNLKAGVDYRWEHVVMVVDAEGNLIETEKWKQWDHLFIRPHSIYVSPYDPDKHVWIVDDNAHAIFKFTNDGSRLVQTLGTPKEPGNDDKHFNRPTFMAWLPDGTFFVSDGYANTRVVKFDKNGKFLMTWGQPGENGKDTRPGYMNNVHGIAVDPQTRRVFVNDRNNHRVQVFDENGKFLDQWKFGDDPYSSIHLFLIPGDRNLWAADRNSERILKYDLDGHFLYQFGTAGNFPGGFWGIHGMSSDQQGNFYVAEVYSGRVQKFRPRAGANPAFLLGRPVRAVWE